jgi:hypothetical protein
MRTGEVIERWPFGRGLGPGLHYSVSGDSVFVRDGQHPILTLRTGADETSLGAHFDVTGNYFLRGNRDGTVHICDLDKVRTRLQEVGLGW